MVSKTTIHMSIKSVCLYLNVYYAKKITSKRSFCVCECVCILMCVCVCVIVLGKNEAKSRAQSGMKCCMGARQSRRDSDRCIWCIVVFQRVSRREEAVRLLIAYTLCEILNWTSLPRMPRCGWLGFIFCCGTLQIVS